MSKKIKLELFYDKYESDFRDGFFPQLEKKTNMSKILITFKLGQDNISWNQIDEKIIDGLDGDFGKEILQKLNKLEGETATHIYNKVGELLYPKKLN